MYLKDGIIPSIIQKRVATLQDEAMEGLHEYHLVLIKRFVSKEARLDFITLKMDPSLYRIIISVEDNRGGILYIKNNTKIITFLDKLSAFLGIPKWTIRFEERGDTSG